jgi:hypothetical protein
VTVDNPLAVPIYALTGQTYCTIVTVQGRVDGQWNPEGRCIVGGPPGWREIPPQQLTRVEVKPTLPADEPLAPNQYRVVFTFRAKSTTEASVTVVSAEFVVADR